MRKIKKLRLIKLTENEKNFFRIIKKIGYQKIKNQIKIIKKFSLKFFKEDLIKV